MLYTGKHNNWRRRKAKSGEDDNQSAQQAKLFKWSTGTRHIPIATDNTCTILGWIISSMPTGET
jgi:hypothetical protein